MSSSSSSSKSSADFLTSDILETVDFLEMLELLKIPYQVFFCMEDSRRWLLGVVHYFFPTSLWRLIICQLSSSLTSFRFSTILCQVGVPTVERSDL